MFAVLGTASVLAFTCGYIVDRNTEASSAALNYLETRVRKVNVRELVESLEQKKYDAPRPNDFVEITGRTWAPQSEYVKGHISGEDVVMSKLIEKEILSVPYEVKPDEWDRVDREVETSRLYKGEKLYVVDESSFVNTSVSGNNASQHSIENVPQAFGLQVPEKLAGVKWIEVDRSSVPNSMFEYNGRKREMSPTHNVNVHVNVGKENTPSKRPETTSKGFVTSESIVPRLKPVVAVGCVEYDNFSNRVIFTSRPLPTEPSYTIGIQYGDSMSLRAKLREEASSSTLKYALYGIGVACGIGALSKL